MAGAEDHAGWLVPAFATATSLKQLAAADLPVLLEQSLPHALQTRLRMEAPARLEVPSGAMVQLNYVRDGVDPLAPEDGEGSGEPPEQPVHALVLGRGDVNEPPPRGHAFWHVLETGRGQTHVLLDAS